MNLLNVRNVFSKKKKSAVNLLKSFLVMLNLLNYIFSCKMNKHRMHFVKKCVWLNQLSKIRTLITCSNDQSLYSIGLC